MAKNDKDVSERLTELLDEKGKEPEIVRDSTPPPGRSLQQVENGLIREYEQVQGGKITDPQMIAQLAERFLAVSRDTELNRAVSFDAQHAATQLLDMISGQQKQRLIEYYRITEYK